MVKSTHKQALSLLVFPLFAAGVVNAGLTRKGGIRPASWALPNLSLGTGKPVENVLTNRVSSESELWENSGKRPEGQVVIGATEFKCSAFAKAIIRNMQA
jgi:hypothetical protein